MQNRRSLTHIALRVKNIEKTVTTYLNEDFNYVITRKQRSILLSALNNLFDRVYPEYKDDEIADLINIMEDNYE